MSLSFWFRDFLYIPLGGSKTGAKRTYLNLLIVFFLCGLWHGASWHFVVWGLYHGAFLVTERLGKHKCGLTFSHWWNLPLTFLIIVFGWVLFRAQSIPAAFTFYSAMIGRPHLAGFQYFNWRYFLPTPTLFAFVMASAASFIERRRFESKVSLLAIQSLRGSLYSSFPGRKRSSAI